MNQYQFIQKLLVKYMSHADEEQAMQAKEDLQRLLPTDLDFDYVYDKVLKCYDKRSMPSYKDLEPYFRYNRPLQDTLYWTALIATNLGEYEFAIEMKYTEEEVARAYREKKGWRFIKGNRQQVRLDNGLA